MNPTIVDNSVEIASGVFRFDDNVIPWDREFSDQEDTFSLHRWNFLLTKLVAEGSSDDLFTWGQRQIDDWISRFLNKPDGLAWTSYTVGERICNGIIFHHKHHREPTDNVLRAFSAFAAHLMKSLEYHGEYYTGNHVANNARSLYFAGQALGVSGWSRLARAILNRELKGLVTKDGFLREGSSHYQLLFTRWMLEVYWLAGETGDKDFVAQIRDLVKKLVERCWFFLVWNKEKEKWSIPLFGDVSPDFRPEWLLDVPWSEPALELFRPSQNMPPAPEPGLASIMGRTKENGTCPDILNGYESFNSSGWYRIDYDGATLFLRVDPNGTPDYPTHSHNDIGSFCLFVEGSPVVVDPGRANYCMDAFSRYGLSALSHNTICIAGHELFPFQERRMLPKHYRCAPLQVEIRELADGYDALLRIPGLSRFVGGKTVVTRTFRMKRHRLEIEDALEGRGVFRIESRFHFAPDILVEKNADPSIFNISGDFGNGKFKFSEEGFCVDVLLKDDERMGGWHFPAYGRKEGAATLAIAGNKELPITLKYSFSWTE